VELLKMKMTNIKAVTMVACGWGKQALIVQGFDLLIISIGWVEEPQVVVMKMKMKPMKMKWRISK